jgi:hypothetical protein
MRKIAHVAQRKSFITNNLRKTRENTYSRITLFVLLFSACIFQVYARKRPIFKIGRKRLRRESALTEKIVLHFRHNALSFLSTRISGYSDREILNFYSRRFLR